MEKAPCASKIKLRNFDRDGQEVLPDIIKGSVGLARRHARSGGNLLGFQNIVLGLTLRGKSHFQNCDSIDLIHI